MPQSRLRFVLVVPAVAAMLFAVASAHAGDPAKFDSWGCAPMDWPNWRGPEWNGVSREKNLPSKWDRGAENTIWAREDLATRSTPIVMNGKLYFMQDHRPASPEEREKVVCADAKTGAVIWETPFNVFLSDVPDTRVAWSSVVGDPSTGRVYAQGVCGLFLCLDGETGKVLWQRSMAEEFGALNTYGGRTNFPVVYDDLVIISAVIIGWGEMAQPAHRFLAFDKMTGKSIWFSGTKLRPEDTTYSTPIPAVINGEAVLVFGSGDGSITALQTRTGKKLWNYDVSNRGISTTPLVLGNKVFAGHAEENLDDTSVVGAFFCLDGSKRGDIAKTGEIWRAKTIGIGRTAPILVDGRLYCVDDSGTLFVVNEKSGKQVGKAKIGTIGWGSPIYADGKIYVTERNGRFFIFEPNGDKLKVLSQSRPAQAGEEFNTSPIISHGRLYLASNMAMYCIGDAEAKPEADDRPEAPKEKEAGDDKKPAWLQVVPVETMLSPGESQQYEVFAYNANGNKLGSAKELGLKVELTAQGVGELSADGKYQAPADNKQAGVAIIAKAGEITGQARVRVIPELPWNYNFDDGQIPVSWVGMRYRHIPIDADLFFKLRKENPLAADLYVYCLTTFTNANLPKAKFQDAGPVERWKELLRYLEILGDINNLDAVKGKVDPAVKILIREKVLEKAVWGSEGGNFLAVERGPRKVDGNGVMCKITTIPKGTRSQGWMGNTEIKDYTITSDVYGTSVPSAKDDPAKKMPDIGLIAQRYRLEMMGTAQELKLFSWVSHEIKFKKVPFAWEPDVWYTMKLQVSNAERNGKDVADVKAKVWKRDDKEPSAWTIEWTDAPANTHGSPGLVGNAKDAEIFFDNVKIEPNKSSATVSK
jgi:outer membrane protein assembly factor BamB